MTTPFDGLAVVAGGTAPGLVITGTRGAGKSTLADLVCCTAEEVGRVRSVTTRPPRAGDRDGTYVHVSERLFERLTGDGELVLVGRYGAFGYGISPREVTAVVRSGRRPLLTISPDTVSQLTPANSRAAWRCAFIDAADDVLDARLAAGGRPAQAGDRAQRERDRAFAVAPIVTVHNNAAIGVALGRLVEVFGLERPRLPADVGPWNHPDGRKVPR